MEFELCCFSASSAISAIEDATSTPENMPHRIELCIRQDIDGASPDVSDVELVLGRLAVSSSAPSTHTTTPSPPPQHPSHRPPHLSVIGRTAPTEEWLALSNTVASYCHASTSPYADNIEVLARGLPFVYPTATSKDSVSALTQDPHHNALSYIEQVCGLSVGAAADGDCSRTPAVVQGIVFGALRIDFITPPPQPFDEDVVSDTSVTKGMIARVDNAPAHAGFLPVPLDVLLLVQSHMNGGGGSSSTPWQSPITESSHHNAIGYFRFDVDRRATQEVSSVIDHINRRRALQSNQLPPLELIFHRAADVLLTQDLLLTTTMMPTGQDAVGPSEWFVWLSSVADRLLTSGGPQKLLGSLPSSTAPSHEGGGPTANHRRPQTGLENILAVIASCEHLTPTRQFHIMLAGGVNKETLPAALSILHSRSSFHYSNAFAKVVAFHGSLLVGGERGDVGAVKHMLLAPLPSRL